MMDILYLEIPEQSESNLLLSEYFIFNKIMKISWIRKRVTQFKM